MNLHELDRNKLMDLLANKGTDVGIVNIKLSSKAQRFIFRYSIKKGIEIVIPNGSNFHHAYEILMGEIEWVLRTQRKLRNLHKLLNPTQVYLKALNETWKVKYEPTSLGDRELKPNEKYDLIVTADHIDPVSRANQIQMWFKLKAKLTLIPWIGRLAQERGLFFKKTTIKNQISRWGSCSEKRNINLNQNLLLIPNYLVEYVIHHELTHLDHLDHSKMFWNSLSEVLPQCLDLRNELRKIDLRKMPLWAWPRLDKLSLRTIGFD